MMSRLSSGLFAACCLARADATSVKEIRVAPDGLVAHYPMQGNCNDVMGNFDATVVGNVQFSSAFGTKGQGAFVTTNSACVASGFKDYVWGDKLSVCVYAKRTATKNAYMGIVTAGYYSSGSWEIRMGREGCETGTCSVLGGGVVTADHEQAWQVNDVPMTMHAWHHICMTYDGALYKFYMNGVLARTSELSSGLILNKDRPLFIGQADDNHESFEGHIDNVRIYNRALDASDIAKLAALDKPDVLATLNGDHRKIICPFLSSMIHEDFLPRKAEYSKDELEKLTLDAGLDPALTSAHIEGNFKDIPTGRIDVFNMEGLPNEHHTSTGINDCNTFFSNCAVRTGPHWRRIPSKYKVCESKTEPCLLPSQPHFDLFVSKADANQDDDITYKELAAADSGQDDEFFVNDINEIGGGTISGAFSFLLDIARDQVCGMSTGLMQRINMDRRMPSNFEFPVRTAKVRPPECMGYRRLVQKDLKNSTVV
jgi:hypothetical protein